MKKEIDLETLICPNCKERGTIDYHLPGKAFGIAHGARIEPGRNRIRYSGIEWNVDPELIEEDEESGWIECRYCEFGGNLPEAARELANADDPQDCLKDLWHREREKKSARLAIQQLPRTPKEDPEEPK